MSPTLRAAPAFVSLALKPLPLTPLQFALSAVLDAVVRRHPLIFDRLGEHAGKRFGIDPTDMPFAFVLDVRPEAPRISVVRQLAEIAEDARIAGPFVALLGLAQGALDGDALFFSRDLVVEGDIAAIVALRNAVDDSGVDLIADAAATLGPLAPAAEQVMRLAGRLLAPLAGVPAWN